MLKNCISPRRTLNIIKIYWSKVSFPMLRKLSTVKESKLKAHTNLCNYPSWYKTKLHCHIGEEDRSVQDSSDISVYQFGVLTLTLVLLSPAVSNKEDAAEIAQMHQTHEL